MKTTKATEYRGRLYWRMEFDREVLWTERNPWESAPKDRALWSDTRKGVDAGDSMATNVSYDIR